MANKRKNSKPKTTSPLSSQARMLFTQLSVQYADATPAQWDELREHLDGQMSVLAGGNEQRRALLVAEFEKVRTQTLATQQTRQLRFALREGRAELVRDRGDGLEEWQVVLDEEKVRLFVPAESDDPGLQVARKALLSGWCPSCRLGVENLDGFGEAQHNPLCPAKKALDF